MNWRLRLAIPLVILLVVAVSVQLYARIASASQPGVNSRPAHAINFPTRQKAHSAAKAANVQGTGDLAYTGGPLQTAPVAYVIFWGPGWGSGTSVNAVGAVVDNYFKDMGHTRFENTLSQYYSTSGGVNTYVAPQLTYGGFWIDPSAPATTDTTCAGVTTIEDSAIQAEVDAAIAGGHFPRDATNAAYFVYTPAGDYVNDGTGSCSELQYCAYHNLSSSGLSYAAMAYPNDLTACGVTTSPNGNVQGDSLANITSHEQFESITDPNTSSGWIDSSGYEIGDKCAWDFSAGTTSLNNSGTFELQTEYSNSSHSCVNGYADSITTSPSNITLTTSPGSSPPPQTVTITNGGGGPYAWQASVPGSATWLSLSPSSGTVNPRSSQPLTVTFNLPSNASGTYSTTISVTDPANFVSPISIPVSVVVANISKTWYFAEGHTGDTFTEFLTLENPNNSSTSVQVQYLLGGGQSPITGNYVVGANARSTIRVNNAVGAPQDVSMVVTASQPIVAERPLYFTYNGLPGYAIPGGSDVLGATALNSSFDFGYLDTSTGHDTWLTILNQNSSSIDVHVSYYAAAGGKPTVRVHTVAANSRGTIHVNREGLPAGSYSALVSLTGHGNTTPALGLVERPLYLKDGWTGYTGSADVIGVSQPLSTWYFAEGYVNTNFSERYILFNPSATATVTVMIQFLLPNGGTSNFPGGATLAPGEQQVINANSLMWDNTNNSAVVTSTGGPILAERFMSFDYNGGVGGGPGIPGGIQGATDVLGAGAPAQLFEFAEGYTGPTFAEYLTIENPNSTAANVTVRYLPQSGGAPTVVTYVISGNSRYTVYTNRVMYNQSFSMEVLSDQPIVAERPMYFSFSGGYGPQNGGSDVMGYAP